MIDQYILGAIFGVYGGHLGTAGLALWPGPLAELPDKVVKFLGFLPHSDHYFRLILSSVFQGKSVTGLRSNG